MDIGNRAQILKFLFNELEIYDIRRSSTIQHKLIFLLSRFGISAGYGFTWRIKGAYSPELENTTRYLLDNNTSCIIEIQDSDLIKSKIKDFKDILKNDIYNERFLTTLAAIVYIKLNHRDHNIIDIRKHFLNCFKNADKTIYNFDNYFEELFKISCEFDKAQLW